MTSRPLDLVFLGLSLSSSWGNGHATTYRALIKALAARGHRVLFLEREQPWYAAHRDLRAPGYCSLRFYDGLAALESWRGEIARADAVILGSYVPQGIEVARFLQAAATGAVAFYDIDTPVTVARLAEDGCEYLAAALVPGFDLYLSFTGGPVLAEIERRFGAKAARPLYCSVDPEIYRPLAAGKRWDLGYLGTYSADRQAKLEALLLEPARRAPHRRFVVAGAQYPDDIPWPANVERIEHVPPAEHPKFYSSLGWALNLTRADMVRLGHSPSVRLFEAAACATPVISDDWAGLDDFFRIGSEIVVARGAEEVLAALASPEATRHALGGAARGRALAEHTAARRAASLEAHLLRARARLGGAEAKVSA
jgi:spore maturation protein CgeB